MQQIQADVVFVVTAVPSGTVTVFPLWECEHDQTGVADAAAQFGLEVAEREGQGHAIVVIHDFRP